MNVARATGDPEFCNLKKPPSRRRWRWFVFGLLALSGLHLLGTGSPIPLVHIERLRHPVMVQAVASDALVLGDGRRVKLPLIQKLPGSHPVFSQALKHGVEIHADGSVYGLIEPNRTCGNDPVIFYRNRVNLSELAGLLDPDGIDPSIIPPEGIQDLKDRTDPTPGRRGLPYDITGQLRKVRLIYQDYAPTPP